MSYDVFVEAGKKKTFAGVIDWPGWCRSGRDEEGALQALVDCGPRYARVPRLAGLTLEPPADRSVFTVVARVAGNATTDFGAPDAVLPSDAQPVDEAELTRWQALLVACWQAFDQAVAMASGVELRKGPRGGGRQLDQMMSHVWQSDANYLGRLAWRYKLDDSADVAAEINRIRPALLAALAAAARGELPAQGPRGGALWTPRRFVRHVAWHVLDHAWEIEDRSQQTGI